ncbi:MAG: hypothetical protein P8Y70_08505 [Candidatus Lokiarchaeota archaeon]
MFQKFKTFEYDSAPFFFYIDVIEPDVSSIKVEFLEKALISIKDNPIMPLPMRIDRVYNGENSIVIRPNHPIKVELSNNKIAFINPIPFLYYGIERLIYYTEVRVNELFGSTMRKEKTVEWWRHTEPLFGSFFQLEKDFSKFLRLYLDLIIRAKIEKMDLYEASMSYCKKITEICNSRIEENAIKIKYNQEIVKKEMYQLKIFREYKWFKKQIKEELHPELFNVTLYELPGQIKDPLNSNLDLSNARSIKLKYIPFLIYDDLLDCMSSNVKILEENDNTELIDPTFLLDNNVIIIKDKEAANKELRNYSWIQRFKDIEVEPIIFTIKEKIKREILENREKYL